MAVDTTLERGKPGVASFETNTFGNAPEVRFGDGAAPTTNITVTAAGADIDLGLYAVIGSNGLLHVQTVGEPVGILAEPIFIADGDSMTIPIFRGGHWNMDALIWDASYGTDALKKTAFEGSISPTILVSKPEHSDGAIYA